MFALFKRYWDDILVAGFLVAYALGASLVALHRYWQYAVFWYDFGIFEQAVWQLSRFSTPYVQHWTVSSPIHLWGDHLNPSVLLLVPLYWITDRREILFIAQVVMVVLAAGVAYVTSKQLGIHPAVRTASIVAFLGFVGTQNALITDVHSLTYSVLFLTLALRSLFLKRWRWYWVWTVIFLGWQENMASVVFGMGIYLLLRTDRQIRMGLYTCLLSFVYGALALGVIIPWFRGVYEYGYAPTSHATMWGYVVAFFSPAMKFKTIFYTFLSFGVVPFFSWTLWPAIGWHYYERFVLNDAASRWTLGMHYNAILVPLLWAGMIDFWKMWQTRIHTFFIWGWSVMTIATVLVLFRIVLDGPLLLAYHPVFYEQTQRARHFDAFISAIPRDRGLIMTQNHVAVFFTHDQVMLLTKDYEDYDPDVVAISLDPEQNYNNFYPITFEEGRDIVNAYLDNSLFERLETGRDTWFVFVRKG